MILQRAGAKDECCNLHCIFSSDRRAIAERGELLSTERVELSRFFLRKRIQKTRRQVEHENPGRDGVLRHETGRLDEDSEQIQVLACRQGPCAAATWLHDGCGRLRVFRLISIDQSSLCRNANRTSEPVR